MADLLLSTAVRRPRRQPPADLESLARVQDVLHRHPEKFGAHQELVVIRGPVESVADGAAPADGAVQAPES